MNSYEEYLERQLKLKEQEIDIYKSFIEEELKCRIKEAIESEVRFDGGDMKRIYFKVIEIPRQQYVIKLSSQKVE